MGKQKGKRGRKGDNIKQRKRRKMYILIIAMPLMGAALSGLFGRKLGEKGAGYITSLMMIVTATMA
jgi:hypothetical protein